MSSSGSQHPRNKIRTICPWPCMTSRCPSPSGPSCLLRILSLPHAMLQPHWSSLSPLHVGPSACSPVSLDLPRTCVFLSFRYQLKYHLLQVLPWPLNLSASLFVFLSSPPALSLPPFSSLVQHLSPHCPPAPKKKFSEKEYLFCTAQSYRSQAHPSAHNKASA